MERLFQTYQFGEAGRQIYDFFWSDFADWYLEIAKLQVAASGDRAFHTADLAVRVFDTVLRLLHPFMPFVTEELWGHLKAACQAASPRFRPQHGGEWEDALIAARWPEPLADEGWEEENIRAFSLFQEVVRVIRNLRAEKNVKPGLKLAAVIVEGEERKGLFESLVPELAALAGLDPARLTVLQTLDGKPEGHVALVAGPVQVFVSLAGAADAQEEQARLRRELAEVESQIARLEALLAGDFANKAPAAVVAREREKLATYRETAEKIKLQLQG